MGTGKLSTVVEVATGKEFEVTPTMAEKMIGLLDGKYRYAGGSESVVTTEHGARVVPSERLEEYDEGVETSGERNERNQAGFRNEDHGGLIQRGITAVEGAVDSFTGSAYSAATRALLPEYHKEFRDRAKENPGSRAVGSIAGAVVPALASGGTSVAARGLSKGLSGRTAKYATASAKAGKPIRGKIVEGSVDMAAYAAQEELVQDELSLERGMSSIGTGAFLGGTMGAVVGGAGKANAYRKSLTKGIMEKAPRILAGKPSAVAKAGKGGKVISSASEEAQGLVAEMKVHHADEVDVIGMAMGGDKGELNLAWKGRGGKGGLGKSLKDQIGLAENPNRMLRPLRIQAQVIDDVLADIPAALAKHQKADDAVVAMLKKHKPGELLKGKAAVLYKDWVGQRSLKKFTDKGLKVSAAQLRKFSDALEGGVMTARRAKTMKELPGVLERNHDLQQRLVAMAGSKGGKGTSLGEDLLTGALYTAGVSGATAVLPDQLGFASPILGALAARQMRGLVFGRMAKTSKQVEARKSAAIDLFIKGGKLAKKVSIPTATNILAQTSFGPEEKMDPLEDEGPLLKAYRAREQEIYKQVMLGPEGPIMTPAAREKVYERLQAVRAISPDAADKMETHVATRVAFLASKLPKRPDSAAMRLGPDTWRPSDMAMREFARYVVAMEDLQGVFERVADGTVTPEDAEVARDVYPEEYRDFQEKVMMAVQTLRKQLPYEKRLALSIFTGVAVDAAMDPRVLGLLQGHYIEEPGGGLSAPKPNPQFGSVTKSVPEPTAGQRRAQ